MFQPQLLPESAYSHLQQMCRTKLLVSPDIGDDLIVRRDVVGVVRQICKELELDWRQQDSSNT